MTRSLEPPRSLSARNVHLYNDDGRVIGGVYQNGSLTHKGFYDACGVFLEFENPAPEWAIFSLHADGETGSLVPCDDSRLTEGRYIVLDTGGNPIKVTYTRTEAVRRVVSIPLSTRRLTSQQKYFRDSVRQRDERCVVTRLAAPGFTTLEATHVFPLAQQNTWRQRGFGSRWITDTTPTRKIGADRIYSPQNGLLLTSTVHGLFDRYFFAINPREDYKVTYFLRDETELALDGKRMADSALHPTNANHRVSDQCLRWHFEQAVLKNMRGAAAEKWPDWEFDFGDRADVIKEIMEGPDPGERMELELFNRLTSSEEISSETR